MQLKIKVTMKGTNQKPKQKQRSQLEMEGERRREVSWMEGGGGNEWDRMGGGEGECRGRRR